jgi:hypothetical protein
MKHNKLINIIINYHFQTPYLKKSNIDVCLADETCVPADISSKHFSVRSCATLHSSCFSYFHYYFKAVEAVTVRGSQFIIFFHIFFSFIVILFLNYVYDFLICQNVETMIICIIFHSFFHFCCFLYFAVVSLFNCFSPKLLHFIIQKRTVELTYCSF